MGNDFLPQKEWDSFDLDRLEYVSNVWSVVARYSEITGSLIVASPSAFSLTIKQQMLSELIIKVGAVEGDITMVDLWPAIPDRFFPLVRHPWLWAT